MTAENKTPAQLFRVLLLKQQIMKHYKQSAAVCWCLTPPATAAFCGLDAGKQAAFGAAVGQSAAGTSGGSVLLRLTFAVCDRRLDEVRPMLALLVRCWLRTYAGDTAVLQEFMGEWLSLAARMARRRWREETAFSAA